MESETTVGVEMNIRKTLEDLKVLTLLRKVGILKSNLVTLTQCRHCGEEFDTTTSKFGECPYCGGDLS